MGGQGEDERAVGKDEREWVRSVGGGGLVEEAGEVAAAMGEKARLAEGGRDDDDLLLGQ